MGRTPRPRHQNDCENLRLLPSCLLPPLRSPPPRRADPGKGSGDPVSTSPRLRWTSPVQRDLLWERSLPRPLRPVWVGSTLSSLRRLDLPLRGGGGGPTRGGNAQLLSRSRPRWEREWKVIGVCSHSSAGSTRWGTRTTRLLLLT